MINATLYLDVEVANAYFEKQNLLYAQTVFSGHVNECLNYPNDFNSTLPKALGLPELAPNVVEGVVIRPVKTRHFNNGVRVILKNKNEQWAENKKYHKPIKIEDVLSDQVLKLQEAILTYVTENRLNNVLSKIGEVTVKDFGKVLGLFNKDILEDFQKDYETVLATLEKQERKAINKYLGRITPKMVRKRLVGY